jgi:DNA-binding NarL/FixJ family response regulator
MNQEKVLGSKITIVIAEGDSLFRERLTQSLQAEPDLMVVSSESDMKRAITSVAATSPDIVLIDSSFPTSSVLQMVAIAYGYLQTRPVLMCSTFDRRVVSGALFLGACGVWMKQDFKLLPKCLRSVADGSYWNCTHETQAREVLLREMDSIQVSTPSRSNLTSREQEVISLTASGMTNRHIGERLQITEPTVKRHLSNIFEKLGMTNRVELTLFAMEHRLISSKRDEQQS